MDAKMKAFIVRSVIDLLGAPPSDRDEFLYSLESKLEPNKDAKFTSPYAIAAVILIRWFRIHKLKAGKNDN